MNVLLAQRRKEDLQAMARKMTRERGETVTASELARLAINEMLDRESMRGVRF
jgi:hypothetical protein